MTANSARVIDFNQPESAKAVGGELATTAQSLVQRLDGDQTIRDLVGLEQAVVDRRMIGDTIKRVEEFFAPLTKMADQLHTALCDRRTAILAPLKRLDGAKRVAMSEYKLTLDRLREARERDMAAQLLHDQQTRGAAEAAVLEHSGEHEMAADVLNEAIAAPAPYVALPDETKAVPGLKFRTEYHWGFVTTELAAIKAGEVPLEFLMVDPRKMNAHTKAMRGTAKIKGIRFWSEQVPVR